MSAPQRPSRQDLVLPPRHNGLPVVIGAFVCGCLGFGMVWALGAGRSRDPRVAEAPPAAEATAAGEDHWQPRGHDHLEPPAAMPADAAGSPRPPVADPAVAPASLEAPQATPPDFGRPLSRYSDGSSPGEPPAERLADIAAAVRAAILGDRPPEFAPRWNPFAPQVKVAAQPVRVTFDNQSSQQATILEVFAHDAPGLLYGVAKAMYDAGLSVQAAKIGTYLDQVVDAFHVTTAAGGKVSDAGLQQRLRAAIEKAATPVTGPA